MLLCLALAVSACGSSSGSGGSGVSGSKKLVELSPSEQDQLCAYSVDAAGGAREVDCGGGQMVTIQDKASCVASFGAFDAQCTATVDDAEGCAEARGRDACHVDAAACSALGSCLVPF
ncbi:MAG TPA: hypothetical protein VFK02_29475 [Kofleriaceae bacterium]|nr:hypothetical protein [Kofleriaceae bacterium]